MGELLYKLDKVALVYLLLSDFSISEVESYEECDGIIKFRMKDGSLYNVEK